LLADMDEERPRKERRKRRRLADEYKAATMKLVLSGRRTAGQVPWAEEPHPAGHGLLGESLRARCR